MEHEVFTPLDMFMTLWIQQLALIHSLERAGAIDAAEVAERITNYADVLEQHGFNVSASVARNVKAIIGGTMPVDPAIFH